VIETLRESLKRTLNCNCYLIVLKVVPVVVAQCRLNDFIPAIEQMVRREKNRPVAVLTDQEHIIFFF
jgi:hypothetical protein